MNICFLIELEKECYKNTPQDLLITRVVNSLEYPTYKYTNDDDKSVIIIDNTDIIIEVGQYKDEDRVYIINIIGIEESDKNKLFSKLKNDEVFKEIVIVYDYLSNTALMDQYKNLAEFEMLLRLYFSFCIIDRYNIEYFDILNKINTKQVLRDDNKNVFNKLYSISIDKILNFIKENKLGGKEYELYLDAFKSGNLQEALNDNIFNNEKIVKKENEICVFRNAICHNRILNCNEYDEKYTKEFLSVLRVLTEEVKEKLMKKFSYKLEEENESIIFFIKHKFNNIEKEFPIIINKIMITLGFSFDINNLNIDLENLSATYKALDSDGVDTFFRIELEEDGKGAIVYIYLIYKENNNSLYKPYDFLEILLENVSKEHEMVVLKDSTSIDYNKDLYNDFNYLENILRAYLTSVYWGKSANISSNRRSQLKEDISVEKNKINKNIFYELDFYDLLQMITRPKGGNQITSLNRKLRTLLSKHKEIEIEELLKNTVEINEDINIIVNNSEELYKYRTMISHSYIVTKKEYDKIKILISDCKMIIENIFLQYIKEKYIFSNKEEIIINNDINRFEVAKIGKSYELQVKYIVDSEEKVYCFLDLSSFNFYKIMMMFLEEKEFNESHFIISDACINYKVENELQLFNKNIDEYYIRKVCNKIPINARNKFIEISSEEAKLEKEIGILLRKIEGNYSVKTDIYIV